jgi:hypothetical protein
MVMPLTSLSMILSIDAPTWHAYLQLTCAEQMQEYVHTSQLTLSLRGFVCCIGIMKMLCDSIWLISRMKTFLPLRHDSDIIA